jgi:hypothetical protein
MKQHPHPPSIFVPITTSNYSSPYHRPHSNPTPSMTEKMYQPQLQRNACSYFKKPTNTSPEDSFDGGHLVKFSNSEVSQPFLYHNPLHYGNSVEDLEPLESGDLLYPVTPSSRQLGSGSGESGYQGGYIDTAHSSSISSSSNPRTPSRHGANYSARANYQPLRNPVNSTQQLFDSGRDINELPVHGTYGLPAQYGKNQHFIYKYLKSLNGIFL